MVPVVVRLDTAGVCSCGEVVAAGERAGTTRQPGRIVCLRCLADVSAGPEDEVPEPVLPGPVAVLIPADWAPPPSAASADLTVPAAEVTLPPTAPVEPVVAPVDAEATTPHTPQARGATLPTGAVTAPTGLAVSVEAAAMTVPSHRRRTLLPAGLLALRPSRGREPGTTSHPEAATRALLDAAAGSGVLALHDRRMPGRRARIAHVALGAAGVYVIDVVRAKNPSVEVRPGDELEPETVDLVVGGRTMAPTVTATRGRVAVVRGLLDEVGLGTVPAVGVLCFVDATLSSEAGLEVDGVHVVGRCGLVGLVGTEGALDRDHLETLREYLTERLPA